MDVPSRCRVVIVGGGFGGLYAARALAHSDLDVVLIDRKNHHTFQPLLYQVALSVLSAADVASSLRHLLRGARNVQPLLGLVTSFDLRGRRVRLSGGELLPYDYLILAAGARHSYFGHDDWAPDAPGIKTIEDAVEIRRRLLLAFERAEREAYFGAPPGPLRFVVVGGGPSGVELAGAIADLARLGLARDFRAIDPARARVCLYEAGPRVLPSFSPASSQRARTQLEQLGVEVHTDCPVTGVEPGRIEAGGEWIPAAVALWATGIAASPLGKRLGVATDRSGRVRVRPDLSVPGHREVFVVGDLCGLEDAGGRALPCLAAVATQQGKSAAANIVRERRGQGRRPFVYRDRGQMATIGHHRAVAEIWGRELSGLAAWLLWSVVHVMLLTRVRNRLSVMRQWAWAYVRREGSSPLITEHGEAQAPGDPLGTKPPPYD